MVDLGLGITTVLGSVAWTVYALLNTVDQRVTRAQSTGELLVHYAQHPLEFFRVVAASLGDEKLSMLYSQSFIGMLGWLDTVMRAEFYIWLWIGLAVCGIASLLAASPHRAATERLVLVLAAAASVLLAFFALLVTWTPHPARIVEGVQGRYFIVPALAIAYAMAPAPGSKMLGRAGLAVGTAFAGVSSYALIVTILGRYH
jgi:uncharacterized membrane protein